MCDWSPYPDNEKDKQIDREANRMLAWCLGIFFSLMVIVCTIAAIL